MGNGKNNNNDGKNLFNIPDILGGTYNPYELYKSYEALIGKKINDLTIEEYIGEGGLGWVYKVKNIRLKIEEAIKIIKPELLEDSAIERLFIEEVRKSINLNHSNLIDIRDFNEFNGTKYIRMEFIQGQTLREIKNARRKAKNPFSEEEVRKILKQILSALKYAHEKGIIHRDLKPENIMIDGEGNIKILDFGISHRLKQENLTIHSSQKSTIFSQSKSAGTAHYMSPEQLKGEEEQGVEVDIWALGIILYELLTWKVPFAGITREDIEYNIENEELQIPATISPEMRQIILKCLEKDKENRYQSVEEIERDLLKKHEIEKSLQLQPLTNREKEIRQKIRKKLKSKSLRAQITVIVFILVMGFLYYVALKSIPETFSKLNQLGFFQTINKKGDIILITDADKEGEVYVDDMYYGKITNGTLLLQSISYGEHKISIKGNKYWGEKKINLKTNTMSVNIKQQPILSNLKIVSTMDEYYVELEGKRYISPKIIEKIPVGKHKIRVGYHDISLKIEIEITKNKKNVCNLDELIKQYLEEKNRNWNTALNGEKYKLIDYYLQYRDHKEKIKSKLGDLINPFLTLYSKMRKQCYVNILLLLGAKEEYLNADFKIYPQLKSTKSVYSVTTTSDGNTIVTGCKDGLIRLWDIKTGKLIKRLNGHTNAVNSICVTKNNKYIISVSYDCTIRFWNLNTKKEVSKLKFPNIVWTVSANFKKDLIAFGGCGYHEEGWWFKSEKYHVPIVIINLENNNKTYIEKPIDNVYTLCFIPDGTKLISGDDNDIIVWDVVKGTFIRSFKNNEIVRSVCVTPDQTKIISGGNDFKVKIWNLHTGDLEKTLKNHTKPVYSVCVTPNGKKIVSGSGDKTIKIWDIKTGSLIRTLKGHEDSVLSLCISPDGNKVISGSKDGTVRLWDINTGKQLAIFVVYKNGEWVSIFSNGIYCCSENGEEYINFDVKGKIYPISPFKKILLGEN